MIIIRFIGGLGNQMFQYALYKSIVCGGKDAYADLSWFDHNIGQVDFKLKDYFGIKLNLALARDIQRLSDFQMDLGNRVRRKLFGIKRTYRIEKMDGSYEPDILTLESAYLSGYWQTEKYFKHIRSVLLKDFQFNIKDRITSGWYEKIQKTESVSIHIRRGDYLIPKYKKIYGDICTDQYYAEAVQRVKKRVPNARFFVFTDDIEWAKKQSGFLGFDIVERTGKNDTLKDMYLMSQCRHNIIANSSYSWWAAWLNENPDKLVISPKTWLNGQDTPDIWCDGWIRM